MKAHEIHAVLRGGPSDGLRIPLASDCVSRGIWTKACPTSEPAHYVIDLASYRPVRVEGRTHLVLSDETEVRYVWDPWLERQS